MKMETIVFVVVMLATVGGHFVQGIVLPPHDTCTASIVTKEIYLDVFVGGLKILYNISTQGKNDNSCLLLMYDSKLENGGTNSNMTLMYEFDGTYVERQAIVIIDGDKPLVDYYYESGGELRYVSGEVTPDGVVVLVDCRQGGNDILIACKIKECNSEMDVYARAEAQSILRSSDVSSAVVNQKGCKNAPKSCKLIRRK